MRRSSRVAVLTTVVALGGCATEPAALSVDDVSFSQNELLGLSEERRGELGEIVALGLMVARGQTERVGEPLARAIQARLLIEQAVAERLLTERGVGDDHLQAQYLDDPRYELTVRHVLFFSERWRSTEHRAQAARKADAALRRLRAGESFPSVAAELSEEPGAAGREGLLPPGREGSWVPEFWRAAVALDEGGISPVVETEYGFHVLRLEAKEVVRFDRVSVAYEVASMWENIPAATDRWLESLASRVHIDEAVARSWHAGTAGDSAVLARWDGGELDVVGLEQHVLSLDKRAWQAVRDDLDRATQEVVAAGARKQAVREALRLGARARENQSSRGGRKFKDEATAWAIAFGVNPGMTSSQVKDAAMAGFSSTNQDARLARNKLASIAPLLRAAYRFHLESNR
ncbi:MAG: peptidylprolyl isomerase [Longimicrobiales bacterium]